MERNVYERNTLYEEVWQEPMRDVAKRYGISDVMLKKVCKQLDVPTPPRGYWAKVQAGQSLQKDPLPPARGVTQVYGKRQRCAEEENKQPLDGGLASLGNKEFLFLQETAATIEFKERIRLRPDLANQKKSLSFPSRVRRVNYPEHYVFEESIGKSSANKAFAVIETLVRAVEQVGGSMPQLLKFEMLGEAVSLEISEETKRVEHTVTAEETRKIKLYENSSWYKFQTRKWDFEFTEQLKFSINVGYNHPYRESLRAKSRHLTQKKIPDLSKLLGKVFLTMCSACAALREERLRKELELKQHEQQILELQNRTEAYNREVARFCLALDESRRYQEAQLLRDYASALHARSALEDTEYAAWIEDKADWLDPLVSLNDPSFGAFNPDNYPPKPRVLPLGRPPHQIGNFFKCEGETPNQSWERFTKLASA